MPLETIDGNLEEEEPKGLWGIWPFSLLRDRPVFLLFLVIFLNGILSNSFSHIFFHIEKPSQDVRYKILDFLSV